MKADTGKIRDASRLAPVPDAKLALDAESNSIRDVSRKKFGKKIGNGDDSWQ